MAGAPLAGSLWMLWLYDVCEEIDLEALRTILGVPARREPGLRHPSPEYVRFERPRWCSNWSRWCSKAAAGCGES